MNWTKTCAVILSIGSMQFASFAQAAIVSHWGFDDGSGTTASDTLGSNNGTLTGSVAFSGSAKLGGGADFTGGQIGIGAGAVSSLASTNSFTVSMWINPTAFGSYKTLFDTSGRQLSLWINSPSVGFYGAGGTSAGNAYSPNWSTGTWQHLIMTYDASLGSNQVKTYRNGIQNSASASTATSFSQAWVIGGNPSGGGSAYAGSFDDLALFDAVLPVERIQGIYNLAETTGTSLNVYEANQLFSLFDSGPGTSLVGGKTWEYVASGLVGSPGDVVTLGDGRFALILGGGGAGVQEFLPAPEPSTFLLLGLGALGLTSRARRRNRRA